MRIFLLVIGFIFTTPAFSQDSEKLDSVLKTDTELFVGVWGIQNMKSNGEIMTSIDEKDFEKIVDKYWDEEGSIYLQMGFSKEDIKESVAKQAEQLAKVTFSFSEDGYVTISANDEKQKEEKAKYIINEKKKEISIEQKEHMLTYTYTINDEQLIMKQEQEELTFVRK